VSQPHDPLDDDPGVSGDPGPTGALPDVPLRGPPEDAVKGSAGGAYEDPMEARTTRWMSAAKGGDRAAFDELVQALRGRAFAVAVSLVGSREDARELCQEAFTKTYRGRDSYREGDPFLPWFHRILRNTCFSFLRKEKRITRHSLEGASEDGPALLEPVSDGPAPWEGAEHDEVKQVFWKSFRTLSARDREILSLRHFQELSYREIAAALGIPEGTVMSRLFHARARLRTALEPALEGALEAYRPDALAAPSSPSGRGGRP